MKLSILVPTFNNFLYFNFFINSIKKNSFYEHEIVAHVNDGSDGTLEFVKNNRIKFTYSKQNIGLCSSMNKAYRISTSDFILYAHDDMYFCKYWDKYLVDEIKKQKDNFYYLTGINVSTRHGLINYNCGDNIDNFDENEFLNFCIKDKTPDLQSSHWAPHLIHRELWDKIGGFSEEFNPGDGSDPDFCMKLWLNNVRVFKAVSKFKVYHFNSLTTRSNKVKLNDGTKLFLLKYGFNPKFFRKYYLQGGNSTISYKGILKNPNYNFEMFFYLIINKIKYLLCKIKI